mmetsp:Transcript_14726/g.25168  ORF Transcript_14726/g.25168 Transcript_14726/m.25168 type:complete len:187 (+) Transcript_14726:77-637(+)
MMSATEGRASISFRLLNGHVLRKEFLATHTLRVAKSFLDQNRTDGGATYVLETHYPYRVFSDADTDLTLAELGFVPSGVIVLTEPQTGLRSLTYTLYRTADSLLYSLFSSLASLNPANLLTASHDPTSASFKSQTPSAAAQTGQSRDATWQYEPNLSLERRLREMYGDSASNEQQHTSRPPIVGFR